MKFLTSTLFLVLFLVLYNVRANTLCTKQDTSCAFQLWNNLRLRNESTSTNTCTMKYFPRNSSECASLQISTNENPTHLGNVRLQMYLDQNYERTLFNITFTNIKWQSMWMKFVLNRPNFENTINSCRSFSISENATLPSSAELFYDCPWSLPDNEGQTFLLDYQAKTKDVLDFRRYIFNVPKYYAVYEVQLQKRELFVYIDYTDTQVLKLRFQLLPREFNVAFYKVEVWRDRDEASVFLDVRFVVPDVGEREALFEYNTWNERGDYYFLVSFLNDECVEDGCFKTRSPKVSISRRNNNLVIGIVGASVIIPVLLFTVFIWNKQCQLKESLVADADTKVLLIYTPSTDAHYTVVVALAQTLQKVFNIQVFLDVLQIPHTNHKDPLLWCSQAFELATHIVYIASPDTTHPKPALYKTQEASMRFLKEEIAKEGSEKSICTVTFPYGGAKNVPEVLRPFRRFDLMRDFDPFVSYLVRYSKQSAFLCKSIFKRNRLMFYSESEYYIDFVGAIKRAQNDRDVRVKRVSTKPPDIKVTVVGAKEEEVPRKGEEEEELMATDDRYGFDVRELNLSGEVREEVRPKARPLGNFDINALDL